MGKVYVKKADLSSGITNVLESMGIGQSPEKIAREVGERQIGDFDFSQGETLGGHKIMPIPLFGDPEAGKMGPKDRHGKTTWIPQYPSGKHLVETEKKIADLAARGIPYSRAISMVLGGISAIDSLANAQPGQSVLGMAHNAATRGYLTHLGASSFLDSPFASLSARAGRGRMQRENTADPHAPLPVPPPPSTPPTPPPPPTSFSSLVPTTVPTSTLTEIDSLLNTPTASMVSNVEERMRNLNSPEVAARLMNPIPPPQEPASSTDMGDPYHSEEAQEFLRNHYGG